MRTGFDIIYMVKTKRTKEKKKFKKFLTKCSEYGIIHTVKESK